MALPRLHRSSVVIGAAVAALFVVIEIPGRVTEGSHGDYQSFVYEHGWPWVYLRRETLEPPVNYTRDGLSLVPSLQNRDFRVPSDLPNWGIPWLTAANWRFWQADRENEPSHWDFDPVVLFCDVAAALFVAAMIVAVCEFRRRRRPRFVSFGLADMLLAVASVSAGLGWLVYLEREYQDEVQLLDSVYGTGDVWLDDDSVCIAPKWLVSLTGEQRLPEFAWRASSVIILRPHPQDIAATCEQISKLKYVTKIQACNAGYRVPFSALRDLEQLETLELGGFNAWFYDEEINELTQLTQLRKIVIYDIDELDPDVLSKLEKKLPGCRIIDADDDW